MEHESPGEMSLQVYLMGKTWGGSWNENKKKINTDLSVYLSNNVYKYNKLLRLPAIKSYAKTLQKQHEQKVKSRTHAHTERERNYFVAYG